MWCSAYQWSSQHLGREVNPHIKMLAVERRRSKILSSLSYYDLLTKWRRKCHWSVNRRLKRRYPTWNVADFNGFVQLPYLVRKQITDVLVQYFRDKVDSGFALGYLVRNLLHWFMYTGRLEVPVLRVSFLIIVKCMTYYTPCQIPTETDHAWQVNEFTHPDCRQTLERIIRREGGYIKCVGNGSTSALSFLIGHRIVVILGALQTAPPSKNESGQLYKAVYILLSYTWGPG
jgi:hypothetical protein